MACGLYAAHEFTTPRLPPHQLLLPTPLLWLQLQLGSPGSPSLLRLLLPAFTPRDVVGHNGAACRVGEVGVAAGFLHGMVQQGGTSAALQPGEPVAHTGPACTVRSHCPLKT